MTARDLSFFYRRSARRRRSVLPMLRERGGHNDVVRDARELHELALLTMLRTIGVDLSHVHDVGPILLANTHLFSEEVRPCLPELAAASRARAARSRSRRCRWGRRTRRGRCPAGGGRIGLSFMS